jgi:coproporphyrinogen III oxidase-like Fe-S oxidoreductase
VSQRDLLIYVHVPFCTQKCHFCDWVQDIPSSDLKLQPAHSRRRAYIAALCRQIGELGPRLAGGYVPRILYFGGGTATSLTPDEMRAVKGTVDRCFDLSEIDEATIEGSPETIDDNKLAMYLDVGFNRISLGVQTLDDDRLRRLGRAHNSGQAARTLERARSAGFGDISVDLISGFPGETVDEFRASLERALALPFDHVSLYPYRPASGTTMRRQIGKGRMSHVDLDEQLAAYSLAADLLPRAGFTEYMFGHFGSPRSRSDLAYFALQMDWIGFGSGASSLYGQRMRENEQGALDRYTAFPLSFDRDVAATEPLVTRHLLYEALTTPEGAVRERWQQRTGGSLEQALEQPPARQLIAYLDTEAGLQSDEIGVRVPVARIPSAYIKLLYLNTPTQARSRVEVRSVVGPM